MIERERLEFPECFAGPPAAEVLSSELGSLEMPVPDSYREFAGLYGGCLLREYPIASVGSVHGMGKKAISVCHLTRWFRKQQWPDIESLVVFSVDLGGNPIGFDSAGVVWSIDHEMDFERTRLASSFDDFLAKVLDD